MKEDFLRCEYENLNCRQEMTKKEIHELKMEKYK